MTVRGVFWDTWAFTAMASRDDRHHAEAVGAADWLRAHGYQQVTTDYVLDESLTLVRSSVGLGGAVSVAESVAARVATGQATIERVDEMRWNRAYERFKKLDGELPRLSFTDCTSFVVMEELGVEHAFTADRHFGMAGRRIRPLFIRGRRGELHLQRPPP